MNKVINKLWNNYLSEECATVRTEEGRHLSRKAIDLHGEMTGILNPEQEAAVEKYIDALADIEEHFVKGAFFKGCEFILALLSEINCPEK